MTKRDEDDGALAIISGGIGALLGYGSAKNKIQNLEAHNRELQNEIIMLRNTISHLQEDNRKLREEKKGNNSVKSIAKSFFNKI